MSVAQRFPSEKHDASEDRFTQIIGSSPALETVLEQVRRVAPTDSTVLILGETGTGKEVIARTIHSLSGRVGRPFIKVNCAAIPLDLLESELFGHEKGAFTGAIAQKMGRFELADKGTLFLDEIGDIPLALQPKLLRVLQEQEFERLGGSRTHQVDVRVVAATHRDLGEMIRHNEFRSDLYYRLNVFPVKLPPLRERREDIVSLVWHFVRVFSKRMGKTITEISQETFASLIAHDWPGNIRELQNVIERAIILSDGGTLPDPLSDGDNVPVEVASPQSKMTQVERALILQALHETNWVVGGAAGAAAKLGMKRTTLIEKMKRFGIARPSHLGGIEDLECPVCDDAENHGPERSAHTFRVP